MPAFKKAKASKEDTAEQSMSDVVEFLGGRGVGAANKQAARGCQPDEALAEISPGKESAQQYQILRALDHALLLGGMGGLARFLPAKECCRLLQPTEVRYAVDHSGQPWGSYDASVWRRYCVKDVLTGKKRARNDTKCHEVHRNEAVRCWRFSSMSTACN